MPGLSFTLPHWLYWVGLIVFPAIAMYLARRPLPERRLFSIPLGYTILFTGGIIGLHRFYLKSLLGLVFIPVFIFILYANSAAHHARSDVSNFTNRASMAQRIIDREGPRIEAARVGLPDLKAAVAASEEGSFARRSAEKKLAKAQEALTTGAAKLEEAQATLAEAKPLAEEAALARGYWSRVGAYALYLLLGLIAIDALLMPMLVRRANASIDENEDEEEEPDPSLAQVEAAEAPVKDADRADNFIDRLSLFCGEFVAYWCVIAVFVYYYEVIARYVFNSPTNWAHESMYLMFGMQYLIAGAYATLTESHVRVDIFYAPLSPRRKALADVLTSVFFFIFAGTLLVTSWIFAMDALAVPSGNGLLSDWARGQISTAEMISRFDLGQFTDPAIRWGEISFNEWEVPLWPMKWAMVVGGVLLLLQGISKVGKDIRTLVRG
ncbi:TRAP transporter small permease subunit [Roseovarius sp. ZX-A-9]|uniref:TRAP transporter small permease subunit n=1 Tax=Roseovarius sp. ZX-A-9 TaxID=3014783 RepID=UPI00232C736C|nr:TRAP transporter small permease subunit [Roseovarius sp. ZX-A-9]